MATLTSQVKLDISGITADTIALDVTSTFTALAGGITSQTITARNTGTAIPVVEATYYAAGTMVYLRNKGAATETIDVELTSGTTHIFLSAGEWAVFPWEAATDIEAYSSENVILEIGVFSAA